MSFLDAIRRLFGRRPASAPTVPMDVVTSMVDHQAAGRLADLVRAGDRNALRLLPSLIGVAVQTRSTDLVQALLGIDGFAPHLRDDLSRYLCAMIEQGGDDIVGVNFLLAAGADPRWGPARSRYPLHQATSYAIADALIRAGADPNLPLPGTGKRPATALFERDALGGLEAVLDGGGDCAALLRDAVLLSQDPWTGADHARRLAAFLGPEAVASRPVKAWYRDLIVADPVAPWAMRLLARLAQAESDVGDQSKTGATT